MVADKQLDGGLSWVRWVVCYWVFLRYVLSWENNFSVFSVSVKSPLDLIPDQRWLLLEVWKCSLLSSNLLSQNAQMKNYFFFIFLALWGALGDSVYTVCSSADSRRGEKKDGQNYNLQDEMGLTCVLRCWCPQHGTQWYEVSPQNWSHKILRVYEKMDSIEFNQKPPLLAFYCIRSLCVFTAELGFSSQKATAALAGVSQFKNYKGDKKMTGDLTILAQLRSSHQF